MKNISNVVGKLVRDIAVGSSALLVARATEKAAKAAWEKSVELYEKHGKKNLSDYKGMFSEESDK